MEFPSLFSIGGEFFMRSNQNLSSITFPSLTTVDVQNTGTGSNNFNSSFEIISNDNLVNINFSSLKEIGVSMHIGKHVSPPSNQLITLSFPKLIKIPGELSFSQGKIKSLDFSSLSEIGKDLKFEENNIEEKGVEFRNLTSVKGNIRFGSKNRTLKIELPKLLSANSIIIYDDFAETLNLSNLKSVSKIDFSGDNFTLINLRNLTEASEIGISGRNVKVINLSNLKKVSENVILDFLSNLEEILLDSLTEFNNLEIGSPLTNLNISSIKKFNKLDIDDDLPESKIESILFDLISINPPLTNSTIRLKGVSSLKSREYEKTLEDNGNNVTIFRP